eukprot:8234496-Pyramimonas_sp.AAC.1
MRPQPTKRWQTCLVVIAMRVNGRYAPNHQHFFNMRLDMDVGGMNNNVYQMDMVGEEMGPSNPFGNAFGAKKTLLETELVAKADIDMKTWRTWKFENPSELNAMGDPVRSKGRVVSSVITSKPRSRRPKRPSTSIQHSTVVDCRH